MHILFFTHYFPPEGNAPASRTYEHCVRWVKAGHRVTVITGVPNVPNGVVYEGYRNRIWPQKETVDGIEVVRVWTYLAPNAGFLKRILNFVSYMVMSVLASLLRKRPDMIVATSPQFFCGWAGVIASWLKWRPLVLEIRDIWPESIVTVGAMKKGLANRTLEVLERWMYRSAKHIVSVGNGYSENILSKVPAMQDHISVVTNGVDADTFTPQDSSLEFREKWELGEKFVCAYVGSIGMAHGLSVVIRAAKRLRKQNRNDIAFLLVGDGAQRDDLAQQVADEGLEEMVKFTGRMDKSQMPVVLASSDCLLVHLKKCDLFSTVIPSKIFEAMAMQRSLIMGVEGESAEIVRQSGAGLFMEPDNDEQLTYNVVRLAEDTELRQSLQTTGRQFVMENYSRDHLADKMLQTLQSVAK